MILLYLEVSEFQCFSVFSCFFRVFGAVPVQGPLPGFVRKHRKSMNFMKFHENPGKSMNFVHKRVPGNTRRCATGYHCGPHRPSPPITPAPPTPPPTGPSTRMAPTGTGQRVLSCSPGSFWKQHHARINVHLF